MKKALTRSFLLVLSVGVLFCAVACASIFDTSVTASKERELTNLAVVLADVFDPEEDHNEQANRWASNDSGIRVTIIAADGTVTGDSQVDYTTMENHADREELQNVGSQKVTIRTSSTLGKKMMYAAIRTPDGYYIRLSQQYNSLLSDLASMAPAILLAVILTLMISLLLAERLVSGITKPILAMKERLNGVMDGSVLLEAESYPYEELRDMARKINLLADEVSTHIQRLQREKDKMNYILDSMREGVILLDGHQQVQMINNSACKTFRCGKEAQGTYLIQVTRSRAILDGAAAVLNHGEDFKTDFENQGRIWEVCFTTAGAFSGLEQGMILTFNDVTETRQAAELRQEFFSNANHELKTPLTAIRGSAELLCSDLPLEEETRNELLQHILKETGRMTTLIEDIIMLSRIESDTQIDEQEPVELRELVQSVAEELAPLASKNSITITQDTEPVTLTGSRKNLSELVSNILVNAVKYNCTGGRVEIHLHPRGSAVIFSVRNDGEPIPLAQQSRVFERFYRVDKGRSRAVGGTGLGLSIVKHVVDSMGGTVSLTSSPRFGTMVTVCLPMRQERAALLAPADN